MIDPEQLDELVEKYLDPSNPNWDDPTILVIPSKFLFCIAGYLLSAVSEDIDNPHIECIIAFLQHVFNTIISQHDLDRKAIIDIYKLQDIGMEP